MTQEKFTKYERARILGARGLQISMDAPLLLKIDKEDLSNLNFDPLRLAEKELDSGVLPISINRPMPVKKIEKLREVKEDKPADEKKLKAEAEEEKEIAEKGEIMELVSPEDEQESEGLSNGSSEEV